MAGLVPAIPARRLNAILSGMPGTRPGMTKQRGGINVRRHPRDLRDQVRPPRAQEGRELPRRRPARRAGADRLLRLGDCRAERQLRGRHRFRCRDGQEARPRHLKADRRRAQRDRRRARQSRQRHRQPPALRPLRQLRHVSECALPCAGHGDGLRDRPLHVPPAPAHPVRGGRRRRDGAQGVRRPGHVP